MFASVVADADSHIPDHPTISVPEGYGWPSFFATHPRRTSAFNTTEAPAQTIEMTRLVTHVTAASELATRRLASPVVQSEPV